MPGRGVKMLKFQGNRMGFFPPEGLVVVGKCGNVGMLKPVGGGDGGSIKVGIENF